MQQPPKKKLLTPKRVNEVADSLENNAYSTMRAASNLKDKAKTDIDKKSANYLQSSGSNDLKNSERYRRLALKAMKKN